MKCPFCKSRLKSYHFPVHAAYVCEDNDCLNDDMPRYQTVYNNYPTYLISRTIMIDKYYVIISYRDNTTTISVLEACFLLGTIQIKRALPIDLNNLSSLVSKIKTLMVFS